MDKLAILAIVVQFVTERIKINLTDKHTGYVAAAIGILVAVLTQTGLLAAFGIAMAYPAVDYVLAGLVLGGGAGVIDALKQRLRPPV